MYDEMKKELMWDWWIVQDILKNNTLTIEEKAHKIRQYNIDRIMCSSPRGNYSCYNKAGNVITEDKIMEIIENERKEAQNE